MSKGFFGDGRGGSPERPGLAFGIRFLCAHFFQSQRRRIFRNGKKGRHL